MRQVRPREPVDEPEADPRQEDPVEIALEDRRKAEIPDRVDEEQPLRPLKPLDMGFEAAPVLGDVEIAPPLRDAS